MPGGGQSRPTRAARSSVGGSQSGSTCTRDASQTIGSSEFAQTNPRAALEPGRRRAVQQPLELERRQDLGRDALTGFPAAAAASRPRFHSAAASRIAGAGRAQGLAGVQPVPAGLLARDHHGDERAHHVVPSGEHAHRERGRGAVVLSHVEVAVAVELDDPRLARRTVEGELLVVHRERARARGGSPSRRRRAACRSRSRPSRRRTPGRGSPPARPRCGARASPTTAPSRRARTPCPRPLWVTSSRCRKSACASAVPTPGSRHAQAERRAVGRQQLRAGHGGARIGLERGDERLDRARAQLGVLVQEQAELAPGLAQEQAVVLGLAGAALQRDQPQRARRARPDPRSIPGRRPPSRPRRRCRAPAPRPRCPSGKRGPDRGQAAQQVLAPVGVDDAEGEVHRENPVRCASRSSIRRRRPHRTTARSRRRWRAAGRRRRAGHLALRSRPGARPGGLSRSTESFYRRSSRLPSNRSSAGRWAWPSTCPGCCATAARPRAPTSSTTSG